MHCMPEEKTYRVEWPLPENYTYYVPPCIATFNVCIFILITVNLIYIQSLSLLSHLHIKKPN